MSDSNLIKKDNKNDANSHSHHDHDIRHDHSHDHSHNHNHGFEDTEEGIYSMKKRRRVLILALLIYIAVILGEKFLPLPGWFLENRFLMMVPFLVPYLLSGYKVLGDALSGLMHAKMFDESFLMTVASIGAFITGQNAEACAVMVLFQIGEYFQDLAVGRSRRSVRHLMDISADFANVIQSDGQLKQVDVKEVRVGDLMVVKPGDRIPVDGTVVEGDTRVDTSSITGEHVPERKTIGERVLSGSINGDSLIKMRADRLYNDSTVASIMKLVESAAERKSKTERFITRFARVYTPAVVIAALALAIIPSIITREPSVWLYRACTFLVISCPCAMVISVPLAFFGGIGAASRLGVLIKGSDYLEQLTKVDTVIFDKTGTLTEGSFEVTEILPAEGVSKDELLYNVAAIEQSSTHPIAKSICKLYSCSSMPGVDDVRNISGKGITGIVDGNKVVAGNKEVLEEFDIEYKSVHEIEQAQGSVVHAASNGRYLGALVVSDKEKPGMLEILADMKHGHIKKTVMLTGDRYEAANATAKKLNIDEFYSGLLPADKVDIVERYIDEGTEHKVAFVGDGINDAPVLSRADVGIAMGTAGSDAAVDVADIVIQDDDIGKLSKVIGIGHRTVKIATENIIFALGVKFAVMILGALGYADMWAAVFADSGVAILCVLNSMRLLSGIGNGGSSDKKQGKNLPDLPSVG